MKCVLVNSMPRHFLASPGTLPPDDQTQKRPIFTINPEASENKMAASSCYHTNRHPGCLSIFLEVASSSAQTKLPAPGSPPPTQFGRMMTPENDRF